MERWKSTNKNWRLRDNFFDPLFFGLPTNWNEYICGHRSQRRQITNDKWISPTSDVLWSSLSFTSLEDMAIFEITHQYGNEYDFNYRVTTWLQTYGHLRISVYIIQGGPKKPRKSKFFIYTKIIVRWIQFFIQKFHLPNAQPWSKGYHNSMETFWEKTEKVRHGQNRSQQA